MCKNTVRSETDQLCADYTRDVLDGEMSLAEFERIMSSLVPVEIVTAPAPHAPPITRHAGATPAEVRP